MAPTLAEAIDVARGKAFVILDGTLLRIDRVGMTGGRDRPYYCGKHKVHGLNVQVLADPAGRLIWISPPLPGARHDMGAAREHGIIDALNTAGISTIADTAYQGGGPAVRVPQRRRRLDPDTGRYRRLSSSQKQVNTAHARQRGPGERANAELKNWKVLRKIRSSPKPRRPARRSRSNPDDRAAPDQVGGSRAGAVATAVCRRWSRVTRGFPVGLFFSVAVVGRVLRFQLPPVNPCMRFSRTRLTDAVHRQHSVCSRQGLPALGETTIP